jgi:choline dehydrogenase-like flavoprotein
MIIDLAASKDFTLPQHNSVVVIGAGPVGIYLSYRLISAGASVVLIEAGGRVADSARNEVATTPIGLPFAGYKLGRAFGLGGTSVVWGGQLAEFEAADFASWPLAFDDVSPWYAKAYEDLSIHPEDVDMYRARLGGETLDDQVVERFFTHWLPQQNFARLFRKQVIDDARTQVLINGTVNGIDIENGRARSVKVRTADGRDLEIPGSRFVFCNGTLEIVRFFLSTAKTGNVPWKHNAAIGKLYQDHLSGKVATAELIDEKKFRNYFENAFTRGTVKLQSKLRPRPELRKDGELGVCGFFYFRSDIQEQLGNIKWLIRSLRSGAQSSSLASLPKDLMALIRMLAPITLRFVRDRRVMAFFDRSLDFMVQCEQRPIERSQIRLGCGEHPIPGLFPIEIDWQVDGQEIMEAISEFVRNADQYLTQRGLARLVVDPRVPLRDASLLDTMVDVYHQAGGMCMSASPERGAVDPECRVWGTSNLYVGGAAIFPSSGHANTTFTALALAARLAATLQSRDEPHASRLEAVET